MGADILRSVKGGYNKESFITKLDAYNKLITAMQNGLPSDKARLELAQIQQRPMQKEKGGLFGKIGYSIEDADAYIADLETNIVRTFK
jgi:hypothetical protein